MAELVRFGISLDQKLLTAFDSHLKSKRYTNRSEAIRDLIREDLIKKQWQEGKEVAGTITMIYDHHKRELVNRLTDIQHDFGKIIISTQHVHLDHYNCLEVVVLKSKPQEAQDLLNSLKSVKGVKHATLSMSSVGREI